jgi:RNA polymerase sigma factor (sigma-70 family)
MPDPIAWLWSFADFEQAEFDETSMRIIIDTGFDRLVAANFVIRTGSAERASCPSCFDGHDEEVVVLDWPDGSRHYFVACPEYLRVEVPPELLERWAINWNAMANAMAAGLSLGGNCTAYDTQCFCTARRLACFSDVDAPRHALLGKLDDSANVERDAVTHEICDEVVRNVDLLTERQALILKMRYGIGQPEHTLEEVGDELKITRERVRQIQAKAEERLQRLLLQGRLRHDDLVHEDTTPEQAAQVEGT